MNSIGITQWSRIFTGIIGGQGKCEGPGWLILTNDGNSIYYVTECANAQGDGEIVTLKYNNTGDSIWVRQYSQGATGGVPVKGPALKLDRNGNIYSAGKTHFSTTGDDYITMKYLSDGTQQWVATYNGPLANSFDEASDLIIDTNLNVYVTGTSSRYNGNPILWDAATIKYSQPNGLEQISSNLVKEFKLGQNYPNPFNPSTKIKFTIPKRSFVQLKVYDILGREKETLVNQELNASEYEVTFDGENYANGIYFYRIMAGDFMECKKMVIIK